MTRDAAVKDAAEGLLLFVSSLFAVLALLPSEENDPSQRPSRLGFFLTFPGAPQCRDFGESSLRLE